MQQDFVVNSSQARPILGIFATIIFYVHMGKKGARRGEGEETRERRNEIIGYF